MAKKCPLCEKPASGTARIRMGQSWLDVLGKPPHSLFEEYMMVHVASMGRDKMAFLHTEADLQENPFK